MKREVLLQRRRLKLHPKWGGVFEGWSRNYVRMNFWRIRKLFLDQEDAMQECALIFVRTYRHYEGVYQNDAHLMALYKTSVMREFIQFAEFDKKLRDAEANADAEEHVEEASGPLAVMIAQSSSELQQVLSMLATAPAEVLHDIFADGLACAFGI